MAHVQLRWRIILLSICLVLPVLYMSNIREFMVEKLDLPDNARVEIFRNKAYPKMKISPISYKPMILLLAYFRSGSTFTSSIIRQAPGVIFLFEPFMFYNYTTLNGYCNITTGVCSNMSSIDFYNTTSLRDLENLYSCNTLKMPYKMFESFIYNYKAHDAGERLKTCSQKSKASVCLTELQKTCNESIIFIKTIRLPVILVPVLLMKFPNLKVVHLVRDPRGMLSSRSNYFTKIKHGILRHANNICMRYTNDIQNLRRLCKLFPGRIERITYEAMAEKQVDTARALYTFLNFNFTDDIVHEINKKTNAKSSDDSHGTFRKNSSETANKWKTVLSLKDIQRIDSVCENFYETMGYKPFHK